MRGRFAVVLLILLDICGAESTSGGPAVSSGDDNVKLALVEKEVQDLKGFLKILLQQMKATETKVIQLETQDKSQDETIKDLKDNIVTLLQGGAVSPTIDLHALLEEEIRRTNNLTKKQDQLSTIQQTMVNKQTLVEATVKNHSNVIATHAQVLDQLRITDDETAKKVQQLQSDLRNASSTLSEDVKTLNKEQKDVDNHLKLQSHVLNGQLVFTKDLEERLGRETISLKNRTSTLEDRAASLENAQQQANVQYQRHVTSSAGKFANIEGDQQIVFRLLQLQNSSITENQQRNEVVAGRVTKIESAIKNHDSTFKTVGQKSSTLEAKQLLHSSEIKNLQLHQTVLENKQKNANSLATVQQMIWRTTSGDSTYSGSIKYLNYNKKSASSSLRVIFTSSVDHHYNGHCHRWYFTFNGGECNNPEKIESILYQAGGSSYYYAMPIEVLGICYGIQAGNVRIDLKIGQCANGYSYSGTVRTGWYTSSKILVEEVDVISH